MISCSENLTLILEKNQQILINWLKQNNVLYHKLIFGKPFADLYVDDKAMNVSDFLSENFQPLKGGSNLQIYQLGTIVKKTYANKEALQSYIDWSKEAFGKCLYPEIISYNNNFLYYKYVNGKTAVENFNFDILIKLIHQINFYKNYSYKKFDLKYHLNILDKNLNQINEKKINFCKQELQNNLSLLNKNASFSHGDSILSNIIITPKNDLFFIDAQFNVDSSSYLLDFAKLNMSLDNYEFNFSLSNNFIDKKYKEFFEDYLKEQKLLDIVKILEYMYILRLYRYKQTDSEKKIILQMLSKLEEEQKWIIS